LNSTPNNCTKADPKSRVWVLFNLKAVVSAFSAAYCGVITTGLIMIARKWKAMCPYRQKDGFIQYLYQTGVKDTSETNGFKGVQIFTRDLDQKVEVTLISYWDSFEAIKAFAGENIDIARLYPEDSVYELEPDQFVDHYEVLENQ
jgi:heme-degrading monooxygenase HmoA